MNNNEIKNLKILKIDYLNTFKITILDTIKEFTINPPIKKPVHLIIVICFYINFIQTIKPNIFSNDQLLTNKYYCLLSVSLLLILFCSILAQTITKSIAKKQIDSLRIIHGDIEVKKGRYHSSERR